MIILDIVELLRGDPFGGGGGGAMVISFGKKNFLVQFTGKNFFFSQIYG